MPFLFPIRVLSLFEFLYYLVGPSRRLPRRWTGRTFSPTIHSTRTISSISELVSLSLIDLRSIDCEPCARYITGVDNFCEDPRNFVRPRPRFPLWSDTKEWHRRKMIASQLTVKAKNKTKKESKDSSLIRKTCAEAAIGHLNLKLTRLGNWTYL